jgi:hypothetical protein
VISSTCETTSRVLRQESAVIVNDDLISDGVLRSFVDDCVVPALVERFLRSRRLPELVTSEHNVNQP